VGYCVEVAFGVLVLLVFELRVHVLEVQLALLHDVFEPRLVL
jgi:hypothetical protein